MSGLLKRVTLCELQQDLTNALIIGIIIAKQQPHALKSSVNLFDGMSTERAVWNFTLRDSRVMYINATCWGSAQGIAELNEKFNVGDVVEIHRPLIEIRKSNNYGEQFRPNVTSPYYLTLSDNPELNIVKFEGNCSLYKELMHLPTKPIGGAYTIVDIQSKREKLQGIDIFGVLRQISKTRTITTQDSQVKSVRDVIILDRTNAELRISIWDPDLINRVDTWQVYETVVFITNVQCKWSDFFRATVATVTSSSIITENPIGNETESLRKHAKETAALQPYGSRDVMATFPHPSTIRHVMNIKQILRKAQSSINSTNVDDKQFSALLFVFVTHLDLDGVSRCVTMKCSQCNITIFSPSVTCSNDNCLAESVGQVVPAVSNLDLRLTLSDHSGSISNCSLSGLLAESVLNCNVQQFLAMTDEQKSNLKWKFLMERCEICVGVTCTGFRAPMYTILSCKLARPFEVGNQLPHY